MRRTLTLLTLCPTVLLAQTTWNVDVGGSTIGTTDPYYAPQNLVIEVGDIVVWDESSGTHNINGSTNTFPNNPASFYSGTPQNTQYPWTFTFTVPGFYEYHCDQQGHAATQFGTITVIDPTNVQEYRQPEAVMLFPVPVQDRLMVSINGCTGAQTGEVLNADGRVVRSQPLLDSKLNAVDLTGLPSGNYYLLVLGTGRKPIMKPFVKE